MSFSGTPETGSNNSLVVWDSDGNVINGGPLTDDLAVEMWWALYRTYGNETALWNWLRGYIGEARFKLVVERVWKRGPRA